MKFMRILMISLAVCALGWAQSGDVAVESTGYGVSKNDAITQAKREALAQGIGQMLTSSTEVENFMVKRDVILTQTMGHVKSYTTIKETQGPDGAWEVRIKAVVSKEGLAKDLAALKIMMQSLGDPRVAFLIKETVMGTADPTAQNAEVMLLEFFKSKDFRVVDPNHALRFRESADGVKAMGGDPEAVAKLGSLLNAEVVVVGSAVAQPNDVSSIKGLAGSGVQSASAVVSLKAYNVSTREVLAAKVAHGAMVNVNPMVAGNQAISKALQALMNEQNGFYGHLVESWRKGASDGQNFSVEISGVEDFAQVRAIRTAVATQASAVEQRSFQKPLLSLEVTRSGTADDLCEALDGLAVGTSKLAVEGVQGNVVTVKIVK